MKKDKLTVKFLVLVTFLLTAIGGFSQVVINEFSAANYDDWGVGGGNFEDWIEFYNPTGAAVDIGGYFLSDEMIDPQKFEIPAGTIVPANGYLVVLASDEFVINPNQWGYLNTNYKISQTRDEAVVFSDPSGVILESYEFMDIGPNQMNHSWGRTTDGSATWTIHTNPSPEGANSGATFTGYADRPDLSLEAGFYGGAQSVSISTTDGSTIYYTTDGSAPTDASTPYMGAVLIGDNTPLRAIAYSADPNILPSFVETNTYFIGDPHTIQTFAITGATLSDGQWWGDEFTNIEHFDANGNFITEAYGDSNEHGNDSNAYGQRGFDMIVRDQLGYNWALEEELFEESSSRDQYQRLIFKAAANDNYSFQGGGCHLRDLYIHVLSEKADLSLDERTGEFSILYINGEYWGIYDVREKADDLDYTEFRYDQRRGFVEYLKTWGGTWQEFGNGQGDWNDLVDFITTNDMSDPANYDYVKSVFSTNSLIDYFVLNSYCVTSDWLNWNTAWWRGLHPDGDHKKWGYVLWDMDASFGHYINYTGIPDTSSDADPCNPEVLGDPGGQGHVPILNALFDNEEFTSDYINRYADLSNTYFTCDYMIGLLDYYVAILEPEMQGQVDRWGGTVAGWLDNVQSWEDYMLDRCSDELTEGMEDCYDVEAVTITVTIVGDGEVELSTITLSTADSPWDGTYYTETIMEMTANSDLGTFLFWEIAEGDVVLLDPEALNIEFAITGDISIIAYFAPPEPQEVTFVVEPDAAGTIDLDGTLLATNPWTDIIDYGGHDISTTGNEWWEFIGWETSEGSNIGDEALMTTTLFVSQVDSIFAVYEYIEHWTVTIDDGYENDGQIIIDGEVIDPDTWEEIIIDGEQIDLTFDPDNEWIVFLEWDTDGDIIIVGDPTDPNGSFIISGDGTIIPLFIELPHYEITVLVQPEGSGSVVMDGTILNPLPYTEVLQGDIEIPFTAIAGDEWTTFSHWEVNGTIITPDEFTTNVTMNFTEEDIVIAVFTVLPHYPITVMVEPRDKGSVIVDGTVEVRNEWTGELAGDIDIPFTVIPDQYFEFGKWRSDNHFPTPDGTSPDVYFNFQQTDTIVAVLDEEFFLFFLPNSFTPNNDGINDIYKPYGYAYELEDYSFQIFDRWGVKVFETTDFEKGWDGSHLEGDYYSPDQIYVYSISIKSVHELEPQKFVGSVQVFR